MNKEEIKNKWQQIKKENKSSHENSYEVIELFDNVLSSDCSNKAIILHDIYDNLLGEEIGEWFKKNSIKRFFHHNEFIEWYTEKKTNHHKGKTSYISETIKTSLDFSSITFINVIKKNFSFFSKEEFKELVIKPYAVNPLPKYYPDIFNLYVRNYVEKSKTVEELKEYIPSIQITLLEVLLKNKWFDDTNYEDLYTHLNKNKKIQNKVLSTIFKYEDNIDHLKLFQKEFIEIIKNNTIDNECLYKGLKGSKEKTEYVFNYLIINESDYTKAMYMSLSLKGNNAFKEDFNNFVDNILNAHLKKIKQLNELQFCIIFKKCLDCGQKQKIEDIMKELKKEPQLFGKVKNLLREIHIVNIDDDKSLDFSKKGIKDYFNKILYEDLNSTIAVNNTSIRKPKI